MRKPLVRELLELLALFGVKHVVCSPGSRNAVLIQQVDRMDCFKKYVVIDERSAAFMALGISLVSRTPVALICTSGSALLNYAPAVAEAYYQGIPLIIISADRPLEWIDQDDSQTIRQPGSLSNFVKASYDLNGDEENNNDYLWYVNRVINEGLIQALDPKEGPVHFNVHLDGVVPNGSIFPPKKPRKINVIKPEQRLSPTAMKELAQIAVNKKIMVVAGFMPPDSKLQKAMTLLEKLPNVCIMAETLSNLHLSESCFAVDTVLFPLVSHEERALAPDIVISLGGALVSRKLKEFIRRNPPTHHWSFSYSPNLIDCFKSLTLKIESTPSVFLQTLAKYMSRGQNNETSVPYYNKRWSVLREKKKLDPDVLPWSDLQALGIIFKSLPNETNLFLSNGTSVRYGQLIPYKVTHATYSNRGVSGIEGSTSTALGGALVYNQTSCLISGDMSFFYDLGGFASNLTPSNFKIIIIDNGGGDIFRFIKATRDLDIREKYLSTDRRVPVEMLAASFDWAYYYADNSRTLVSELEVFFSYSLRPSILHIDTSHADNSKVLTEFLSSKK